MPFRKYEIEKLVEKHEKGLRRIALRENIIFLIVGDREDPALVK